MYFENCKSFQSALTLNLWIESTTTEDGVYQLSLNFQSDLKSYTLTELDDQFS